MEQRGGGLCSSLQNCVNAIHKAHTSHSTKHIIKGQIIVQQSRGESVPGSAASVQLFSCSQVDPSKSNC